MLELKRVKGPRAVPAAVRAARRQIEDRGYRRVLEEAGASPIRAWALAFDGKTVTAKLA